MFRALKYAAVAVTMGVSVSAAKADVRLTGSGATFPQPLYQRWVKEYQNIHSDAVIDYSGGGSGKGIKDITDKVVDFAGSDAPMSKREIAKAGGAENLIEFPTCAGGVVPAFNLPGIKDLNFDGALLADIYMGKVSNWNDPRIADLNHGAQLPDLAITCAWRTDGSGTNFVWTNYLATQSDEFKSVIGIGKQVKWPVGQGGKGNPGVAAIIQQTPGAIGYVEENYADQNGLSYGSVKNASGAFVKASPMAVSNAAGAAASHMNGEMLSTNLWNQAGSECYPVASFTYIIIYKDLHNLKSKDQAQTLINFLTWAVHDGQKMNAELGYAPLHESVVEKVDQALQTVTYQGEPIKPQ